MLGINFCDVHTVGNPGIFSRFLQMSSWSNPRSLFVIEFQLLYSSSTLPSFKSNFRSARKMLDKFRISVARVAKTIES